MNPEKKYRRLAHQSAFYPPAAAKPLDGGTLVFGQSVVPVSSVARDWRISARRVRSMLTEGRLAGRQLDNGYWEVFYPYRYVFGTRGPLLQRQKSGLQELAAKPKRLRGEEAENFTGFLKECKE